MSDVDWADCDIGFQHLKDRSADLVPRDAVIRLAVRFGMPDDQALVRYAPWTQSGADE